MHDINKLHRFLKKYAFHVSRLELEAALDATDALIAEMEFKKGLFFKLLLQKMFRRIDWTLAETLEDEFRKKYPKARLYMKTASGAHCSKP